MRSAQRTVAEKHSSVRSAAVEANFGAVLSLTGDSTLAIPKGNDLETHLGLQNVGTEPATSIRCSAQGQQSLSVTPSRIESLADGERERLTVAGTPERDGAVVVSAATNDRSVEETVAISVVSKAEYIARARQSIDRLRSFVAEELDETGSGGRGQKGSDGRDAGGLSAKLDAAVEKLDDAREHLESDRPEPANGNLRAAQRQLGAFINSVQARRGKSADEKSATLLTTNAT
ncbi:hypothetical protein [Halorussus salinisoli]|uniref:hypothetical protein n=1 Tax=Halorussus salinisoli TaxID=2558242 RepID=UPI0010C20AAC|nr:hypothetical protein [Halorussus salinisoli]